MKKPTLIIVISILIFGLAGGSFWVWYQSTLQKSLNERSQAQSRVVETKKQPIEGTSTSPVVQTNPLNQPSPSPNGNTEVSATKPPTITTTVSSGNFVALDPAHYASGVANITQENGDYYVVLGEDFKTNPDGPDLYVWLVKEQKLGLAIGGVDTNPESYLNLGPLEKKEGSARYKISKGEAEKYSYAVVIWCKAFGVQFSNAILTK
jgi:Electron transfer DM13